MSATRAIWTVTGGVILGQPTFERVFALSSTAWEEDPIESFMETSNAAHQYHQDMSDPTLVNWVNLEFTWM